MHVLLLHGSLLGPWSWKLVADRLAADGHRTSCPELPFTDASAGYAEHLAAIDAALVGDEPDVVVAHSAAGLLAPSVLRASPAPTIYVAPFLPDARRSVFEQWDDEPDMFCDEWVQFGAAPPWEDAERAHRLLLHDCSAAVAAEAVGRLRADRSPLAQRRAPASARPPAAVVVPTLDRTLSPAWMRRAARERLGAGPLELTAGHLPQLSRPAALGDLIVKAALS